MISGNFAARIIIRSDAKHRRQPFTNGSPIKSVEDANRESGLDRILQEAMLLLGSG